MVGGTQQASQTNSYKACISMWDTSGPAAHSPQLDITMRATHGGLQIGTQDKQLKFTEPCSVRVNVKHLEGT